MIKRAVLIGGLIAATCAGFYFATSERRPSAESASDSPVAAVDPSNSLTPGVPTLRANDSNAVDRATGQAPSREFDLTVNPYASALREPGRSKRSWSGDFLQRFPTTSSGDPISFELTDGRVASGTIRITQYRDGELTYLSGELSEPEPGKFFFLTPPAGGKAGKAVGVVEFPASQTAYRIEPTGPNGDPELWQRHLEEVVCVNLPLHVEAPRGTNETAEMPPLRPDLVPEYTPSYNSNIVSLQSYPGSPAVLLLDFFGGYTPTWGGVTYPKPNVSNAQIRDLWKRVAEDFLPFNINVTTDTQVFQAASASSRQRCVFTPSSSAVGSGAAGVAYIGSWNWGSDTVCWSIYTTDKNGAEVGAHEPGHTLGLGHQGTSTQEYFSGHGTGTTGWAPIMGTGYTRPVSTWARGEYQDANNTQDELSVMVGQNNNVDYRPDEAGGTLATSRYLEVYPDFAAMAEGVIERSGDTDAFQFTTSGGQVSLTARPVGEWANLAVMAMVEDAVGAVIASNNPPSSLSASISTNLPEGTYTFRVAGAGRNNPLNNGFSAYGSLGYYSVVGWVEGARLPTRLSVVEHVPNGTFVGVVPSRMAGTNDPLVYAIVAGNPGNTFFIDGDGVVAVANNTLLAYHRWATNSMLAVQFELFVNITNLNDSAQTELNRRVVITVVNSAANQPMALTGWNAGVLAPYDATTNAPKATAFDLLNNYCFYQAGLNGNPQVGSGGGRQGLAPDGRILSLLDGTVFQLGPYGGTNALMLGYSYPRFGTLTLAQPRAYNSLAVLASSANGGGNGTLVLNFTNGDRSQVFSFRAQDWYGTVTNVAVEGFGRLRLGQSALLTEDPGVDNPNLYQTTLNLAALGLNQSIASMTFTNPAGSASLGSGIFAVSGVAMPPEVNITQPPRSVTNNVPTDGATFTSIAMGAPPLSWQWYFSTNGTLGTFLPLSGQTGSNLVLNAVLQTTNVGSYRVVVTNHFSAATSSVATLTLHREPVITRQPSPTSLFLFAGRSASFSVGAAAALPTTYYWRRDATPVAFSSTSNYTIGSLQPSHTGNYTIVVSNAYGTATSSVVSLTVFASPTNYPYVQAVMAGAPLGYWRLNEISGNIAHDYLNGRNGTYNSVRLDQAGYNPVDPDRAAQFGPGNNSYVGGIPLDFATSGSAAFSIEAWVRGNAQTTDAGIVTKGMGAGGEQFNLDTGAGGHAFRFFVRDGTGAARLANGTITPNGNWQHVVGVCNQAAGLVVLYVNGVSNASGTITAGSRLLASTNAVTIGSRQSGTADYDHQFNGWIDEVAIYGYALNPAQVQARYAVRTNVPPAFTANPFAKPAANAGLAYSGTIASSAADPNGDALTFSKISGPAWLSIAASGALSGTPLSSNAGDNNFVVRASDPAGLFANATMNIAVIAPIVAAVSAQGTDLLLNWTGGIAPYQVQMTTNLVNPNWQNVGGILSTNNVLLIPTNDAAYFRVLGQ